ncbi:MAG: hypothetical protein K0R31_307 [Clostridiales bacterium]|nr:hypothetical protein [Clostridiales bacterium]
MIYHNLYPKSSKKTVSAGIIGTGHFGTAVITQSINHKQLKVPAIADKNIEAIKLAFKRAGITDDMVAVCDNLSDAKIAFEQGKYIAVTDPMLLMELPIDVVIESTGNPEAGAKHGLAAINKGKHIIMVNKETDSCVGPVLFKLAKEKGVIYTPIDGDQHGLLIQMVEWARDTGINVICAGKSRDAEFIYNKEEGTVTVFEDGGITIPKTITVNISKEDAEYIDKLPDGKKAEYLQKRKDLLSELDPCGGFDLCEMVIAANSLGLKPDVESMYDAIIRTSEIPKVLCEKKDGGILTQNGVIEVVTCLREPQEAGLGGGVFMVVNCENEYSQMILATKGCLSNTSGSTALIYRPYHLCGVEAPTTIMCAGLLEVATGPRAYKQLYDIVQVAAVDLKAGDVMGNDHDKRMTTNMVPASPIKIGGGIPAHMLSGRKLIKDVPKGTLITFDMIEKPQDSVLWQLREMQDELPL